MRCLLSGCCCNAYSVLPNASCCAAYSVPTQWLLLRCAAYTVAAVHCLLDATQWLLLRWSGCSVAAVHCLLSGCCALLLRFPACSVTAALRCLLSAYSVAAAALLPCLHSQQLIECGRVHRAMEISKGTLSIVDSNGITWTRIWCKCGCC